MSIRTKIAAALATSFLLLAGTTAQAAITWVFNYTDPMGVGFNAAGPTGDDRRAALEQSAATVGALFAAYTATITMDVNGSISDGSTLAAAGSNANLPLTSGFGNAGDVMVKILGGADPDPFAADGVVLWNFADFMWDTGDSVPLDKFDFKSTAIHELLHAVGFVSDIAMDGSDLDPGVGNSWGPFDEFMADSVGRLIDPGTFMLNTLRWGTASVGGAGTAPPTNGLYFDGANAKAAFGGNPIPIYSPNPWEDGSSGSHMDDAYFNGSIAAQLLMNSATGAGPSTRTISAIEIGILKDIGYTAIIPVPAAVWLLGSALLALFGIGRYRTTSTA